MNPWNMNCRIWVAIFMELFPSMIVCTLFTTCPLSTMPITHQLSSRLTIYYNEWKGCTCNWYVSFVWSELRSIIQSVLWLFGLASCILRRPPMGAGYQAKASRNTYVLLNAVPVASDMVSDSDITMTLMLSYEIRCNNVNNIFIFIVCSHC